MKQTEWNVKYDSKKYLIQVFAKTDGRANSENKYDFPPPIDTKLFYGSCAIVGQIKKEDGTMEEIPYTCIEQGDDKYFNIYNLWGNL